MEAIEMPLPTALFSAFHGSGIFRTFLAAS
jgi:hypothetical protein